jgi:hypothetical protein
MLQAHLVNAVTLGIRMLPIFMNKIPTLTFLHKSNLAEVWACNFLLVSEVRNTASVASVPGVASLPVFPTRA